MSKLSGYFPLYILLYSLIKKCNSAIYTYEDIELRRIFPSEFPQDTIRKSGSLEPEHLGRYAELKNYFKFPKAKVNSHFEELVCYNNEVNEVPTKPLLTKNSKQGNVIPYHQPLPESSLCRIDLERYSPEEDAYYLSPVIDSHVDRRRVYCFMLLCFTEDEIDRVVASF